MHTCLSKSNVNQKISKKFEKFVGYLNIDLIIQHLNKIKRLLKKIMNLSSRFSIIKHFKNELTKVCKNFYSNATSRELKVEPFCDIHVNLPYHVNIKPFDVHKNPNLDKINIDLVGVNSARSSIKHVQNGNNIKIISQIEEFNENITCQISAPIKSNLNIKALGNISAGFFNGSKLILNSAYGSIFVEKYNGERIDLKTENGNIILKGAIIAANINAVICNNGSIRTKRLQGLNTHLKTNNGDIIVKASYSDACIFEAKCGNMDLQNIHKNSKIFLENGNLNINGLDGQTETVLGSGCADIQLSRIQGDSKITIKEKGELILRLSEECQEDTCFEIISKERVLDPSIKLFPSKNDNTLYLTPRSDDPKNVLVDCKGSLVKIQAASWMNMLKLNVQK